MMRMMTFSALTPGSAARTACLIASVLLNGVESETTTSIINETFVGSTGAPTGTAAFGAATGAATGLATGAAMGAATGAAMGAATGDETG